MALLPTSPTAPVLGSGITPGGGLGAQLTSLTRRAVIPTMFVQLYQSHPLLSLFFSNAQSMRGGISQISFPIQCSSFTTFQWGGFSGDFAMPSDQNASTLAQFDAKVGMVPVGFFGMEAILQSSEVIIPKLRLVMSDAGVVMKRAFAQALYANNSANTQAWDSLPMAYDDGTNSPTYGGIARTGNQSWKGQYITNQGGAPTTRQGMLALINRVQSGAGGEAPDYVVMNPANWSALVADFQNFEMYVTKPSSVYGTDDAVNTGFRAILVGNVPVFSDPYCPLGECYLINSRYTGLYLSEYAPLTFTGFESTLPQGQLAEVGVLLSVSDLVCAKPSSGGHVTGITSTAWSNTPGSVPQLS